MKTESLIIGLVIGLIIGAGAVYFLGKSPSDNSAETKKLQDATIMMKEQSASIKKMGDMMLASGLAMQEMGMKYKDDGAIAKGKDLEAVGKKYIEENTKATEKDSSMKEIMK